MLSVFSLETHEHSRTCEERLKRLGQTGFDVLLYGQDHMVMKVSGSSCDSGRVSMRSEGVSVGKTSGSYHVLHK